MTSNEALSRSQGRGQISDDQAGTTAQPSLCQSDHARAEVARHGLGSVLHEPFHVDARPAAGIENAPASDGRQKSHPSTMAARRLESNIGGVRLSLMDGWRCGNTMISLDVQSSVLSYAALLVGTLSMNTTSSDTSQHSGRPANQLAGETSPYLLQHAHNPVDWHPWGSVAIERARSENKPIFLSIGYSACHWCHVMERESFENPAIAAIMNEHFINIKVDREERPDLDQIYMNAVQAMTGHGGWPMSVFLTPRLEPFFGGTYFPPTDSRGMLGFPRVLSSVHRAWEERRDEILARPPI